MIEQLASPSVCVVDDEERDYRPILAALNSLFVSCVHLPGTASSELPSKPFRRVQLVFLDLHLSSGATGKSAASHTANVFMRLVSPDTAPIIVVLWSKYAKDRVAETGVPAEDQITEAELFKKTLLEAESKYRDRLIFVEMDKPKPDERGADWTEKLKIEINNALQGYSAVELLWAWDSLVKNAVSDVNASLTTVAAEQAASTLKDNLKSTFQRLTRAQAENDLSAATAPRHFISVLGELLSDQLERTNTAEALTTHGAWLADDPTTAVGAGFAARMNGLLLTAGSADAGTPYGPGTIYRLTDSGAFAANFGETVDSLIEMLCGEGPNSPKRVLWRGAVRPILLEISPVCDVAQNNRSTAFLVAGLIVPVAHRKLIKGGISFTSLPAFDLRWAAPNYAAQDSILVFCHRLKASFPADTVIPWISPWFRLRELPTASVRNAQSGHASRIGFVSLQG